MNLFMSEFGRGIMHSVKKNFIYNSFYQILSFIVPLITTPYISRVLGSEGVGKYSYHYAIAYYFTLFIMLGVNHYGNREIAQNRDDKEQNSKIFWSIYALQFGLGIIVNAIYIFYCLCFSKEVKISLIMSLYTLSTAFDISWFCSGMEDFYILVYRNILVKIVVTAGVFLCVKERQDVLIYSIILSAGSLLSQIAMLPYLKNKVYFIKPQKEAVLAHLKPNLYLFLPVIAVSLYKIMDKIMLGIIVDEIQVGYYELSERIIQLPMVLVSSLGTVMLPRMCNLVIKDKALGVRFLEISIICAMFFSSSMSFGIMAISKEFVPLFYGNNFETCITLFLILLPSCPFLAFANVIRTQYILPNHLDTIYLKSVFFGALVNILANLIFIPCLKAVGAAIGTLCAEIVVCIYIILKVRRQLNVIRYIQMSLPFIFSGIILFFALYNCDFNISCNLTRIIIKIILGIIIYIATAGIQLIIFKNKLW